jgi:SNF2 family DNA or RNA helicase
MLVFHSIWDRNSFYVWAESSERPVTASERLERRPRLSPGHHPFSLPGGELRDRLPEIFGGAVVERISIRLPSTQKGPLPSPWLLLDLDNPVSEKAAGLGDWVVEALAFGPCPAFDLLAELPAHPLPGIAFASSIRFWSDLAMFSLELIAREMFAPAVRAGKACWTAVIDEVDYERLSIFCESMPASCRALHPHDKSLPAPSPRDLVMSFIDGTVDSFVRRSLDSAPLLPPRRGRRPKVMPLAQQFLQALSAEDSSLKAPPEELRSFSREMQSWLDQLHPSEDMPFRASFRLEPPAQGEGLWTVRFFLQARDDRSLLVPAEEVWRTRSDALTFLKRRLKNPQEQLLADLGRASRIFPQIERSLEAPRPVCLEIGPEEAYSFLRQSAPLLEQNGFGVLLPPWWERPSRRLGVKLRLRPAPAGSEGGGHFGLDSLVAYDWELALGDEAITEDEFAELARLKVPLVQARGEWVELRAEDIEAAIEFFKKQNRREISLGEALRLGLCAESELEGKSGLPVVGVEVTGWIEDLLRSLSEPGGAKMEPVGELSGFNGSLRPYQARGVSWLEHLHRFGLGACLADDMGLGKTIELIAFLLHEREGRGLDGPGPTLLISPMSVVGNWQREFERFAPSLRVGVHHGTDRLASSLFEEETRKLDVVITTYSLAQRDEEILSAVRWKHIVLDEAQNIKNPSARQTQAIKRLRAGHRVALTGTPVENRLSELWSIMDFLNPGYLGSARSFRKDFVLPIERYRNKGRQETLRSIIQPFILRRLKTDPAIMNDLPEKMEMRVNYNLTPEQASLYAAVVDEMLGRIEQSLGMERRGQILSALTRLKQICNHPALFLQDGSPLEGRSGKLIRLEEMLYEVIAEGERALIFTQFAGMGAMLRHHLQDRLECEVLFLHGGTPKKQRDAMIQRFQSGGAPLFVLSLKAGGLGLNLTAANHVFHFDRWWNPAVENQATDRVFRIGQKKNVFVHKFVCLGTLEERIDQMIEEKRSLAESVIGTGEAWLTELSNDDLKEILALRRDAVSNGGDRG